MIILLLKMQVLVVVSAHAVAKEMGNLTSQAFLTLRRNMPTFTTSQDSALAPRLYNTFRGSIPCLPVEARAQGCQEWLVNGAKKRQLINAGTYLNSGIHSFIANGCLMEKYIPSPDNRLGPRIAFSQKTVFHPYYATNVYSVHLACSSGRMNLHYNHCTEQLFKGSNVYAIIQVFFIYI